jgi:hypothetical protein
MANQLSIGLGPEKEDGSARTICLYGLHSRFPVSLYASQWQRLLTADVAKAVNKFIADHKAEVDKPRPASVKAGRVAI